MSDTSPRRATRLCSHSNLQITHSPPLCVVSVACGGMRWHQVMRSLGVDMPEGELLDMVKAVDHDRDGAISYDEFVMMARMRRASRHPRRRNHTHTRTRTHSLPAHTASLLTLAVDVPARLDTPGQMRIKMTNQCNEDELAEAFRSVRCACGALAVCHSLLSTGRGGRRTILVARTPSCRTVAPAHCTPRIAFHVPTGHLMRMRVGSSQQTSCSRQ